MLLFVLLIMTRPDRIMKRPFKKIAWRHLICLIALVFFSFIHSFINTHEAAKKEVKAKKATKLTHNIRNKHKTTLEWPTKSLPNCIFDSSGRQVNKVFKRQIIGAYTSLETVTTTQCHGTYDYITWKYIGWSDVTYLWSQCDRHFVGQWWRFVALFE